MQTGVGFVVPLCSMLRRFFNQLLFDKQPATFESAYDVQESVRRLSSVVRRWPFVSPFRQTVVGSVKQDKVVLTRFIPFVGNSLAPEFYGAFLVRDGVTLLEGYFALSLSVRRGSALWFGSVIFMAILFPIVVLTSSMPQWQDKLILAIGPSLILVFGLFIVKSGKWFARNDAAFISDRVRSALQPDTCSEQSL